MPSDEQTDDANKHPDTQNNTSYVNDKKEKDLNDDKTKEEEKKEEEQKESKEESEEDDEEEEESDEEDPLYAQLASKYNLKVEEKLKELEEEEEEKEGKPDSASSRLIDLRKLNRRYNPQQSSALQHILVEYGLPNPDEEKYEKYERYKEQKRKAKKKKRRDSDSDWDDTDGERTRPEYFDSIFHDRDKLPDYLQDDYAEKLEEKIAKQRKAIQKRSEELERKLQERQEKHLASMGFQKKLQRHELSHDAGFLKAVPKSNAYKFIQYENKLRSAGKFKTRADVEEFWENTKDPFALKNYMNRMDVGIDSSNASSQPPHSQLEDSFISSRTSSMSSITTQEKERTVTDFRPLTQIEEMKEPSRPSTRDANAAAPWAITQGFPAKLGHIPKSADKRASSPLKPILSVPPSPLKKTQDPYTIARQAAAELDKKHPNMQELPPMYCFSMEVGEKPPDPQEVMKQMQAERREKERRLFVKRIRKMYHLAQANTAATQRIMEKRNDFQIDYEAAPTDTWLSAYDFEDQATESLTEEEKFLKTHPWLQHVRHRAIVTIAEESEPPSGFNSQKTSASLVRQRSVPSRSASKLSSVPSREAQRPLPLTLDAITENASVKEAKCLSTLWTNYMGVGKSVYAK